MNKIKLGTLTYHKADNYGAVLQAYALCKYLQDRGYDAGNIDYWPIHHAEVYKLWCWNRNVFSNLGKRGKLKYVLKFPYFLLKNYCRKRNFDKFRNHYMTMVSEKEDFDAVFYGSDTIWNHWNLNSLHKGFDEVYWGGGNIKTKYRFSYAPSMGNVIDTQETENHCKKYLPLFTKISVRESELQIKFQDWGFRDIVKVVDPTMLLSMEQWKKIGGLKQTRKKYLICYNLENSPIIDKLAETISKEQGIRRVNITGTVQTTFCADTVDTAGPIEFLSLFSDASYILTSSFHGVVFSIIFNKMFCFHSSTETERISSLLRACHLEDRFIDNSNTDIIYKQIDYQKVGTLLDDMVKSSKEYIDTCLSEVENNGRNL